MRLDDHLSYKAARPISVITPYWFWPGANDQGDGSAQKSPGSEPEPGGDLPYKVELWNNAKTAIEQVLAVTASSSIGYAAYYAAVREYPDRRITLRHKGRTMVQANIGN